MVKAYTASPQFWRVAAEEARKQTGESKDPQERRVLQKIADSYDWLAQHAAERLTASFTELLPG